MYCIQGEKSQEIPAKITTFLILAGIHLINGSRTRQILQILPANDI